MTILKLIHIISAGLSLLGFLIRGFWLWRDSPRLHQRWVKILPHVIDTVLLASAVALLVQLQLNPVTYNWLVAKLVALVVYIFLGMLALKWGRTKSQRLTAWAAAVVVFGYILGVAGTKSVTLMLF
jgi:uncharacterized membrane protein SirB2